MGVNNLKKLLKKNLDSVEKQIKEFYKKYGDEGKYAESLSYAEFQKYKAKLRLKAKQNPQDKTLQRLAKQDIPKYRIDRLRALQTDLQIQLTEATRGQEAGIYKTLKDVAKVSQATTALRFKKTLDVAFDKIASRKLEKILSSDWVGNMNWSERLWKDRELVGKKVTEILETGLPQGKSMQEMARDLKDATNSSFNDAFRLIRTESAHVDGEVLLESFKQAQRELGYTKYIFDATIDNRTSKICADEDNKSYLIDEAVIGENFPPLHPNCRSTAVLDESSIDESVIEDSKQEEKEEETQEKEQQEKPKVDYTKQEYKNISNDEQIIEKMHKQTESLAEDEISALKKYTKGDQGQYYAINGTLRGDLSIYEEMAGSKISPEMQEKVNKWIKNIDAAMDKSSIPENIQLYRGGLDEALGTIFKDKKLQEFIVNNAVNEENLKTVINSMKNKTFTEKGFMSTSYSKNASYSGKVRLRINAPKGAKGLMLDTNEIGITSEQEVLLKQGYNWQVKDVFIEKDFKEMTDQYIFDCYFIE
jgi:SPP1 gp7 family putative phage head morphogenesis protein